MDLPTIPQYDMREACIERAAAHYRAPPDIIRAVIRTEGGRPGQIRRNTNGSYDMGTMQINSVHLPELSKYGITREMLVNNDCLNIHIGTYYLQKHIIAAPHFWHGVGNYHSVTPTKNVSYQYRVWNNLNALRKERIQ